MKNLFFIFVISMNSSLCCYANFLCKKNFTHPPKDRSSFENEVHLFLAQSAEAFQEVLKQARHDKEDEALTLKTLNEKANSRGAFFSKKNPLSFSEKKQLDSELLSEIKEKTTLEFSIKVLKKLQESKPNNAAFREKIKSTLKTIIENRKKMIEKSLWIIRKYSNKIKRTLTKSLLDIEEIQEIGIISIIQSLDRYNPNLDEIFERYAATKMHFAVIDFLRSSQSKYLAKKRDYQFYKKIKSFIEEYKSKYNQSPSTQEIAEAIKISEKKVKILLSLNAGKIVSIHSPINPEKSLTILDTLSDPEEGAFEERVNRKENLELIPKILKTFSQKKKTVIELLYFTVPAVPANEIGERLEIHKSRVSQIKSEFIQQVKRESNKEKNK
ncbi:MAG: hypothetical protein CL678_07240 [Bdellovibrionaceae bacterium]|nr:hypothetical protein [Pseudobdellovibrionaceae bacterium]|tara:strand:+ start:1794 stop:2945 length:1152 start_codon:yes stop_codon:yes gene_type:complete